jgi:hypothetical protein
VQEMDAYGTGTTIPVPRSKYEANGYKPDFDKLPWEAEYWAAESKRKMMPRGPKGEKRPALDAAKAPITDISSRNSWAGCATVGGGSKRRLR